MNPMEYGCKTVVHGTKLGDIPGNVKCKNLQDLYAGGASAFRCYKRMFLLCSSDGSSSWLTPLPLTVRKKVYAAIALRRKRRIQAGVAMHA
ncbi:hypothetical protein SB781_34920, partial [Paraburkholderia sp. SIMBA_061]